MIGFYFRFRFLATPFCLYIGITNNSKLAVENNPICERVFTTVSKNPNREQVSGLAKQLDWKDSKVQRWFRKRRKALQLPMLNKATESCWRCIFYFSLFVFGAFTVLTTDWFYNTRLWMTGYIRQVEYYFVENSLKLFPILKGN